MSPSRLGNYAIDGILGEGAHGVVYRARDGAGRQVALKVLREQHATDDELHRRFLREAQLSIAVIHPNVVQAYAAGDFDGKAFLSSELVAGGSVHGLLERQGRVEVARALRIAADLFRGLHAIHLRGLVHRDIKPANLLLAQDGTAKVADLGLCRTTQRDRERFTVEGAIVGTPAFVAPEQIERGEDIDIRADLYASGVLLYQCLSGVLPFTGESVLMLLEAHLKKKQRPLDQFVQLPPGVSRLVDELLAKDPRKRPRDPAAALARVVALQEELHEATARAGMATTVIPQPFPGTLPPTAPGVFPGTLPPTAPGAFPATVPPTAPGAPGGAFPVTMPGVPVGAFPATIQGAPAAVRAFPRTVQEPAGEDLAFPQTIPDGAFAEGAPFAATIPSSPAGAPAAPSGPAFAVTIQSAPAPADPAFAVTIPAQDGLAPGGTLSGAGLTLGSAPAVGPAPVAVSALPGTPAPALRLHTPSGQLLFCLAGPEVVFGRDAPGGDPRRVCLRVFPGAAMAEQSRRISGRHFTLVLGPDGVRIRDLGSTLGTTVDGRGVPRQGELAAGDGALIRVADVLSLRLRLLPAGAPPRLGSGALGLPHRAALLERVDNGVHHRYLVAGAPVGVDGAAANGSLAVGTGGPWRLCAIEGTLWWLADSLPGAALPAGTALPALPGGASPGCATGPINPDDYKG